MAARVECTPEQKARCPLNLHVVNRHHIYWPAYEYRNRLERAFRSLAENVVLTCTYEHNLLHALESPPEKPSRDVMLRAVTRPDL